MDITSLHFDRFVSPSIIAAIGNRKILSPGSLEVKEHMEHLSRLWQEKTDLQDLQLIQKQIAQRKREQKRKKKRITDKQQQRMRCSSRHRNSPVPTTLPVVTYTTEPPAQPTRKNRLNQRLSEALLVIFPPEYCIRKSPGDGLCCDTSCIRALHNAMRRFADATSGAADDYKQVNESGRKRTTADDRPSYPSFNLMRHLMYCEATKHPQTVAECYLSEFSDDVMEQRIWAPRYGFEWDDTNDEYHFVNTPELLRSITDLRHPHYGTGWDIGTFIEHTKSTTTPVFVLVVRESYTGETIDTNPLFHTLIDDRWMLARDDDGVVPDVTKADVWFTFVLHSQDHYDNIVVTVDGMPDRLALRYAELPAFAQRYVDENYVYRPKEWLSKQGWQKVLLPGNDEFRYHSPVQLREMGWTGAVGAMTPPT